MTKKLYAVRVLMYVMAENTSEACVEATRAHFDIFDCTARKADRVHAGWEDTIPYNADSDRTCAEILAVERSTMHPTPLLGTAGLSRSPFRVPMKPAAVPSSPR